MAEQVKQFSDLTAPEREELRSSMNLRSLKEGTELLDEVRCVRTEKPTTK